MRVLSWWLLVQSWSTLRFDDHRGLLPRDFKVSETGLLAKLTRSKVSGPDKHLNFRVVVIRASAYVQHKNWLSSWMGTFIEGRTTRSRLSTTCTLQQLPRLQDKGTEVRYGLRGPNSNYLSCVVPRFEDFSRQHRALLHTAQRT